MNKTSTSTRSVLGDICEVVRLSERTHYSIFCLINIEKSTMKGIFWILLMYLCLHHWLHVKKSESHGLYAVGSEWRLRSPATWTLNPVSTTYHKALKKLPIFSELTCFFSVFLSLSPLAFRSTPPLPFEFLMGQFKQLKK